VADLQPGERPSGFCDASGLTISAPVPHAWLNASGVSATTR
jgi:hypothetical protein